MNSKLFIGGFTALSILASTLAPSLAFAQENRGSEKRDGAKLAQNTFCERLAQVNSKVEDRFADNEKKFSDKKHKEVERLAENRSKQDARILEKRAESTEHQAKRTEKLLAKAPTGTQKIALEAFQTAVQNAVKARREAFDLAQTTYRAGVDAAVSQRTSTLNVALTTYKAAVKQAKEKALADCSAGVDQKVIKTNLKTALKTAEKAFKEQRKPADNVGEVIKKLLAVRKEATKKAMDTFHTALEKAKADLKTALGK